MQIDWLTVGAQIVNFLILIYLLKRFLYQPVMNAMAQREQRIADRLTEARQREQQAGQERDQYRDKNQKFEQQRQELFEQAKKQSEQQRQQLVEEARHAVEQTRSQWQQDMERERQNFYKAVSSQTAQAIVRGVRRVLADLADTKLEERIVHLFLQRLQSLDAQTRQRLAEASEDDTREARITTSFEADETVRSRITQAVRQMMGEQTEVNFTRSEKLLSGVELNTGDQTLGWNMAEYLDEIEADLEKTLANIPAPAQREEQPKDAEAVKAEDTLNTVKQQTAQAIVQGMRRALADLADSELEERMVQVFLRRLRSLDERTRQQLREMAEDKKNQAQVVTSFHLDETARSRIIQGVGQVMGRGDQALVSFEQSAELLSGIVLSAGTLTVGWTMSDYLDDMEADLEKTLAHKTQQPSSARQYNQQHSETTA
jgi:F-type H+-transporting ATPase subunit b